MQRNTLARIALVFTLTCTGTLFAAGRHLSVAYPPATQPGAAGDSTPPPAPALVKAVRKSDRTVEITWDAAADFESGIKADASASGLEP
jgi:hypothetical protein